MSQDQVHDGGGFLLYLINLARFHARILECLCRAARRIDRISELLKAASDLDRLALIRILHGDDHLFELRQIDTCSEERLIQSLLKGLGDTETFARGLHLRS